MKTPAALSVLLSALLALPAAASTNIRVGRVAPVSPVGGAISGAARVSGASLVTTPSLSVGNLVTPVAALAAIPLLAPPVSINVAAAAPTGVPLVAPTVALAARPVAAAASDAPRLAVAQGIGEAAVASQEALRGGHEGQARAFGIAAFDGAMAAAADAPAVPGGAPEGRRSSGLAPPSDREIAEAFAAANPKSKAREVLGARDFSATAAEIMVQYTFASHAFVEHLASGVSFFDRRGQAYLKAVKDLVAMHDATDEASRRFQELAGRYYAYLDAQKVQVQSIFDLIGAQAPPHMPPSPLGEGEYWDMAAGINAGRYVRRVEVDRVTPYVLFDASHFVGSFLRASAEIAGKSNIAVREEDLMRIAKPAKPIAVLRTKNAAAYVPGFEKKLEEMVDWIAPGGQLIIQNDPNYAQRGLIIEKHGPLAKRLIMDGWDLDFGFAGGAGEWGAYGYDTVVLTRPAGAAVPKTAVAAVAAWQSYIDSVRYANRRESGY